MKEDWEMKGYLWEEEGKKRKQLRGEGKVKKKKNWLEFQPIRLSAGINIGSRIWRGLPLR